MLKFIDTKGDAGIKNNFNNVVVITYCGNKFDCSDEKSSCPEQLKASIGDEGVEVLRHLVKNCKPTRDAGASSESYVKNKDGDFFRLCLCVLPDNIPSRHAAFGHNFAVTELLRANKGKNGNNENDCISVFLVLQKPTVETYAACCAISRVFHTYNNKSSLKTKTDEKETNNNVIVYTCASENLFESIVDNNNNNVITGELPIIASCIQTAASLVDMPPNELNPTSYTGIVKDLLQTHGLAEVIKIEVVAGQDLDSKGFGGIFGVGKASDTPPALVILSHTPINDGKSVCLIGKGITYDTGGLSIKTKTGMPGMKRDMGGSAGVLGAFISLVKSGGIGADFHCLLCLAENAVGSRATRPDDIHLMYSGKTVEINNTDAEGRLVMADGLAYAAKHLNPTLLINMATLTGAQGVATGTKHAAIFTNSEEMEKMAVLSGRLTGDLCHPLPYSPEFFRSEFKSAVADMKNSQKNRSNAGCACPATFLQNHIEDYVKNSENTWLHIDMASPAYHQERATGYGVALLFHLIRTFTSTKMLK